MDLTPEQNELIAKFLELATRGDKSFFESLSDHEKKFVIENIPKILEGKDSSNILESLWSFDYEMAPVDIDTFIDDKYYLGEVVGEQLYDEWRKNLREILDPTSRIVEWLNTGAIGTGKTTASIIATLYKLYRVLCLKSPQSYYGLGKEDPIVFGFFNLTLNLIKSTTYQKVLGMIRMSPFFREMSGIVHRKLDPKDYELLKMPKNIMFAFGSSALHGLGMSVYGGIMSEVNFSRSLEFKQVTDLYSAVRARIESRFLKEGRGVPGLLILDSSRQNEEDWLETHIKSSMGLKSVKITSYALWDVKKYSSTTFNVIVGDRIRKSQVLEPGAPAPEGVKEEQLLQVPVDFYDSFIRDPENALRDLAGIATYAYSPLIRDRQKVYDCIDHSRAHPFIAEEVSLSIDDYVSLVELFEVKQLFDVIDPYNKICRMANSPSAKRYIHIDLARTGDCAGIAMAHIAGRKIVERPRLDGTIAKAWSPYVVIDFMLRITPPRGSEIDFGKIREFVLMLQAMSVQIGVISFDRYQSADSIQILKKEGLVSKVISVDKDANAYIALRDAIYEQRVSFYEYRPFLQEVTTVQFDRAKYKVDHPVNGSKDVSDAVAGCLYSATVDAESDYRTLAPITEKLVEDQINLPEELRDLGWVVGKTYRDVGRVTKIGDWYG